MTSWRLTTWLAAFVCVGCEPDADEDRKLCLASQPAHETAFNSAPELQADDVGNALIWWRASDTRPEQFQPPEGELQTTILGKTRFARASTPQDIFDVAVLAGSGRLLTALVDGDEILQRVHAPSCGVATQRFAGPGVSPRLAANMRGDSVLAWGREYPGGQELNVVRIDAGRVVGPQPLVQVDQAITVQLAVDRAGRALAAFEKPEPIAPYELAYHAEASTSAGDDEFGSPEIVFEGSVLALASSTAGDALLTGLSAFEVLALHIARFDGQQRWHELPQYGCQGPACDVKLGISRGASSALLMERTPEELRFFTLQNDEIREQRVLDPVEQVVSHALDVGESGEATAAWLTTAGVHVSRFTPRRGWSAPALVHPLELELESRWDGSELSARPPYWSAYPMQVRRLSDGRELIVWAQYDDLVTKMGSDYYYREATASSVWSLLLDGARAQVQRLSLPR